MKLKRSIGGVWVESMWNLGWTPELFFDANSLVMSVSLLDPTVIFVS